MIFGSRFNVCICFILKILGNTYLPVGFPNSKRIITVQVFFCKDKHFANNYLESEQMNFVRAKEHH